MENKKISNIDDFLSLLRGVKKLKSGEYLALCPAHNDHQPSLSVNDKKDKLLIHCKAGCNTEAVLKALGLAMADLFFNNDKAKKKIVAVYPYHDTGGEVIYEVVRYKPKAFSQRRPSGGGDYIWNINGVTPVLYHLPEVIKAVQKHKVIYIVEGEKDADILRKHGFIASCNPMGVGKWKPSYSDQLSGGRVVVIPDNDEPGLNHAIDICNSLHGKVKSLKLLQLPGAHDVSDWLDRGNTDVELKTLMDGTHEYTPLNVFKNNTYSNTAQKQELASKRDNFGTSSGQDEGKEWGFYAQKFDEFMQEANGRVDKREVAEAIGLKVTSDTFRKILSRRKSGDKPQVRAYRGSHNLIEWINRDYRITPEDIGTQAMLEIRLPLNIPEYVKIPSRSVAGIAGYKSTGKTAFLLETAELNVYSQELPVYYWYNEMGELLLNTRLEDYPLLPKARREGRFRPVMQTTFEFTDVIDPDAINLIDYIDRDDDIWLIGEDIRKIFTPLNKGCSIFALQKKRDSNLGYGGTPTLKLPTLYITLDEKYHSEKGTHGIAKIIVCKNWENINPVGLSCEFHTGGKHGKLFIDGEWKRPSK